MLRARTYAEVHLYLDLHPCACGSPVFDRDVLAVTPRSGTIEVAFTGPCERCGYPRSVTFELPDRTGVPPGSPYRYSFPDDGPSEVIDPGEWYGAAQAYAGLAAQAADELDQDEAAWAELGVWEDMVSLLARSATAVEETLRFVPQGAPAVPSGAFFRPGGREVYQASPDSFAVNALTGECADRWRRLELFTARHPEPA